MIRYKACCSRYDSSCFILNPFKIFLFSLCYVVPYDDNIFEYWSNERCINNLKRLTIQNKFERAKHIDSGPSFLGNVVDVCIPSAIISESDAKVFVSVNLLNLNIVHKYGWMLRFDVFSRDK